MGARPKTFETYQPYDPVERIVDVVRREPRVEKAILFGSRARGDHRPRSDVDLAIVAPGLDAGGWRALLEAVETQARTLIGRDLVLYRETSGAFRQEIDRFGVVVYERA